MAAVVMAFSAALVAEPGLEPGGARQHLGAGGDRDHDVGQPRRGRAAGRRSRAPSGRRGSERPGGRRARTGSPSWRRCPRARRPRGAFALRDGRGLPGLRRPRASRRPTTRPPAMTPRIDPRRGAEGRRALGRFQHAEAAAGAGAQEHHPAAAPRGSRPPLGRPRDRRAGSEGGHERAPILVEEEAHDLRRGESVEPPAPRVPAFGEEPRPAAFSGPRAQRLRSSKGKGSSSDRRRVSRRPLRSSMCTTMSPQNSHRICRHGPQGAVSRLPSATTAIASKRSEPFRDRLEDRHPLGAQGEPVGRVLDVAAGHDLARSSCAGRRPP